MTIGELLREPFPASALGWKPQSVKDNRALAVAYIDARDVMDRLDDVVGPENWQDDYTFLPDGSVLCRLSVRFAGEWVTKCDVGGESEQPDKSDREKAAVSDALKRAAVKFGIGRYLYSMPSQWCDYDQQKRRFVNTPTVPAQFLPRQQKPAQQAQQNKPAQQSPVFAALLTDLRNSGSKAETLRAQWEVVYTARMDGRITDAEFQTAEQLKDELKAKLPAPQTQK